MHECRGGEALQVYLMNKMHNACRKQYDNKCRRMLKSFADGHVISQMAPGPLIYSTTSPHLGCLVYSTSSIFGLFSAPLTVLNLFVL